MHPGGARFLRLRALQVISVSVLTQCPTLGWRGDSALPSTPCHRPCPADAAELSFGSSPTACNHAAVVIDAVPVGPQANLRSAAAPTALAGWRGTRQERSARAAAEHRLDAPRDEGGAPSRHCISTAASPPRFRRAAQHSRPSRATAASLPHESGRSALNPNMLG